MTVSHTKSIITYFCNSCNKQRAVIFPSALKMDLGPRGLVEYVDVHPCIGNELVANILYVDPQFAVRSQVPIKKGEKKQSPDLPSPSGFIIPTPKKAEMAIVQIQPSEEFIASNLRELEIEDNLRQLRYKLSRVKSKQNFDVEATSKLEFVSIKANITDKISKKGANKCIQSLADSLEQIVYLEEIVFNYIVTFMDSKLKDKFDERHSCEIELILQLPAAVPYSDDNALKLFKEKARSWFSNLSLEDFQNYNMIVKKCLDNQSKTLLDIFKELEEDMKLALFISAIYNLHQKSLLNLDVLKFISFA